MDELIRNIKGRIKPTYIGRRNLGRFNMSECIFADDVAIVAEREMKC